MLKNKYIFSFNYRTSEMDNFNKIIKKNIENLTFHAYPKSNKQKNYRRG